MTKLIDQNRAKKIIDAKVLGNDEIAPDIFRMVVSSADIAGSASPGQFINVYPKAKHTLLPRPISICEIGDNKFSLVYRVVGQGTKEFSAYRAGDNVRVSTPLGNGFNLAGYDHLIDEEPSTQIESTVKRPIGRVQEMVLVGGGVGVPPLVGLAKELVAAGNHCIAAIGFQSQPFLVDELKLLGVKVHLATDTGDYGYKGTVVDLIREKNISGDCFFACGPKMMLLNLATYCNYIEKPLQVSIEEQMGCGYGACVGCVCKIKENNQSVHKKVCLDGPVFNGLEVIWDAD